MQQRYLLILAIGCIAMISAAPVSNDAADESSEVPATTDSSHMMDFFQKFALQPLIKFLSEPVDNSKSKTLASTETPSMASTPNPDIIVPPKVFGYGDDVVYHIANLTYLGYMFIVILIVLSLTMICCCCCCCCCRRC